MDLPFEIIESVLLHISKFNVLQLNTVSQQFNDVISGSARLMDRVILHWRFVNKADIEEVLRTNRKYRNISVNDFDAGMDEEVLIQFMHEHSKHLRRVELIDNAFQGGTAQKLLEKVSKNLIELKIELQSQNIPEISTLELNKLKKFHCTLQEEQSSEYVMMLLKKLKGLDILFLENCIINGSELQTVIAVDAKKLTLENCSFEWSESVDLVGSQRLEDLTISTERVSRFTDENYLQQIVKTCPNLKTLFLEWTSIGFETSLILATKAKNLRNLRVDYCKIDPITFPTIESYETFGGCLDDALKLIRINRQLKKVKIDHHAEHEASFRRALIENPSLEVEFV